MEALGLSLRHESRVEGVLADCLHVDGEQIVDCLCLEPRLVEFAQGGRRVLEAARGGVQGGRRDDCAALAVACNAETDAQGFQCGLGFVLEGW